MEKWKPMKKIEEKIEALEQELDEIPVVNEFKAITSRCE